MPLPLPSSLSPSKVSTFRDCALAFRFSAIDRLAELDTAWEELGQEGELDVLGLDEAAAERFLADARALVRGYLRLEDPDTVTPVGVELTLEARVGGLLLRGIIDRLDVLPGGELVVVDYKTGRVPPAGHEQQRLAGVQFYALLCEEVLGRRPSKVRLLYLRDPVCIEADPSDQALRGLRQRTQAIWSAIERACDAEDFRPKPSALCGWCSFKALCPAFGGDPALASSWPLPEPLSVAS